MLPTMWVLKWIQTDPTILRVQHDAYFRHGDGGLGLWENEKRAKMAAARNGWNKPLRGRSGYYVPVEIKLTEIEATEK